VWPQRELGHEMLVLILRVDTGQQFSDALREEIIARNRRLPDFKRVVGYIVWDKDFPRTASMKIKRNVLADELRQRLGRHAVVKL